MRERLFVFIICIMSLKAVLTTIQRYINSSQKAVEWAALVVALFTHLPLYLLHLYCHI